MKNKSLHDLGSIALLVVDIQNDFCDDDGEFAHLGLDVHPAQAIVPRLESFIAAARMHGLPVIFSKQIESKSVSPPNLRAQFKAGKLNGVCAPGSWGSELYTLKPLGHEHVLEKYTYDVFSNPMLEKILRKHKIKTLIVTGVNTDICIDTTIRSAFTHGYHIVVPRDLIATMNKAGERFYLNIFDMFFGVVTDARSVLEYLRNIKKEQNTSTKKN